MKKSSIVAALQAQTQLKCAHFLKLEDIAHVGWLIILRVKLAEINHVYRSLGVQLWGAFSCCWAEVQLAHTTQGIHVHDSELHSRPRCVFVCVCSQTLMNNLSRNDAGATGLAWWSGEEFSENCVWTKQLLLYSGNEYKNRQFSFSWRTKWWWWASPGLTLQNKLSIIRYCGSGSRFLFTNKCWLKLGFYFPSFVPVGLEVMEVNTAASSGIRTQQQETCLK